MPWNFVARTRVKQIWAEMVFGGAWEGGGGIIQVPFLALRAPMPSALLRNPVSRSTQSPEPNSHALAGNGTLDQGCSELESVHSNSLCQTCYLKFALSKGVAAALEEQVSPTPSLPPTWAGWFRKKVSAYTLCTTGQGLYTQ